ncbi:MAG: bacteriohopanetetrol glucosamine biosynthesis glycosyltransferase HpnI [Chthonomonadales bacterium]|nr:bacteriohopanetetrol glucosamine biosynthesis glycosyltransferase HpnI [Chthonomonadales bacterium]
MLGLEWPLGLALAGSSAYWLLCVDAARRWRQEPRPEPDPLLPVTVLKPLRGIDPEQYANLESFCRQEHACHQLVLGAFDPADPALVAARRLREAYPAVDIAVVAGGEALGANRKVSNLAGMLSAARHDTLVLSDSDMRVRPDYLARVAAPFRDPRVGLVTCLYRGARVRGLGSVLEAGGIAADFAPSVLLARRLEGMRFAFGSSIAIRRRVLDEIGGFEALVDELADDYLLGWRTHAAGHRVVLSDYVVDDVLGSVPLCAMWRRRLRWARTMRAVRPAGVAGSVVTHTAVLGLLLVAASGFAPAAWAAAAASFTLRAAAATWIGARCLGDGGAVRRLPLLPVSDLLAFALWTGGMVGSRIEWRGEAMRLGRGGRLLPVEGRPRRAR